VEEFRVFAQVPEVSFKKSQASYFLNEHDTRIVIQWAGDTRAA
jgi:hypothetical protein